MTVAVPDTGQRRTHQRAGLWLAMALSMPMLGGCAVIAVADVASSVVIGTAGLAVDAAVGTAKVAGKVVGKSADLVFGSAPAP